MTAIVFVKSLASRNNKDRQITVQNFLSHTHADGKAGRKNGMSQVVIKHKY